MINVYPGYVIPIRFLYFLFFIQEKKKNKKDRDGREREKVEIYPIAVFKMTEKRTRRPDEAQSEKPARERHRIKRRRVDDVPHESKKPTDEAIEKALENSAEKAIDTPTERSSKTALQSPKTKSPKKKEKNAVAKADKTAVGKPTQEQAIVQKKELNGWRLSPKTGGRLLDLDPVFSRDEK